MNNLPANPGPHAEPSAEQPRSLPTWVKLAIAGGILGVCFCLPLYQLVQFSLGSELYSHIILIPLVSAYLIFQNRSPQRDLSRPNYPVASGLFVMGVVGITAYVLRAPASVSLEVADRLCWQMLSLLFLVSGACAALVGRSTLARIGFPLAFLIFAVPMPVAVSSGIETFLQHSSATAAAGYFSLFGTTFFRNGTYFQLPGFALNVAPECSGIRSSVALFITSVFAGYIFLRSPGRRAVLAFAVIPLAILRNGFRVFVIGELCVHVGPHMIDSPIHHQGGPIFFALSLIPFSLLLFYLVKSERRPGKTEGKIVSVPL